MAMNDDQFKQLMDRIDSSSANLEAKFSGQLEEVAANQASSSQEVMAKLSKRPYQFKKKGNEAQFIFNETVDEKIDAAKRQLELVPAPDEATKTTLKRAMSELDQGKEAIRVRQKHIRIADHPDWDVVEEYEADKLASDSDDEKRLYKARKEREAKKRKAASASKRKPPRQDGAGVPRPQANSGVVMKQPVNKTRPIGPCYNCAGWGHLANSCPKGKQQLYPLIVSQPVVSGLDFAVGNVNVLDDYNVKQPADGISGVSAQVPDGGTS